MTWNHEVGRDTAKRLRAGISNSLEDTYRVLDVFCYKDKQRILLLGVNHNVANHTLAHMLFIEAMIERYGQSSISISVEYPHNLAEKIALEINQTENYNQLDSELSCEQKFRLLGTFWEVGGGFAPLTNRALHLYLSELARKGVRCFPVDMDFTIVSGSPYVVKPKGGVTEPFGTTGMSLRNQFMSATIEGYLGKHTNTKIHIHLGGNAHVLGGTDRINGQEYFFAYACSLSGLFSKAGHDVIGIRMRTNEMDYKNLPYDFKKPFWDDFQQTVWVDGQKYPMEVTESEREMLKHVLPHLNPEWTTAFFEERRLPIDVKVMESVKHRIFGVT